MHVNFMQSKQQMQNILKSHKKKKHHNMFAIKIPSKHIKNSNYKITRLGNINLKEALQRASHKWASDHNAIITCLMSIWIWYTRSTILLSTMHFFLIQADKESHNLGYLSNIKLNIYNLKSIRLDLNLNNKKNYLKLQIKFLKLLHDMSMAQQGRL